MILQLFHPNLEKICGVSNQHTYHIEDQDQLKKKITEFYSLSYIKLNRVK